MRLAVLWLSLPGLAVAHIAAWHPSMYCLNGNSATLNYNANNPVNPLYMLTKSEYWFHHVDNCDQFPPDPNTFLELPAGGCFTVEHATNRAFTTLGNPNSKPSDWPNGQDYSNGPPPDPSGCITDPNLHTKGASTAAGTAFAISYTSTLSEVTLDNLVVFTVRYNTPWKRVATYDVPANMPPCPPGGCICAWVWIPDGCGEPNIYMQGLKCMVTNSVSTTPLGKPQPPVWCEDDQSKCVQGPKQIMIWHQAEGDNIEVQGSDLSGKPKSPGYNSKCGFKDGAQDDIFASGPTCKRKKRRNLQKKRQSLRAF